MGVLRLPHQRLVTIFEYICHAAVLVKSFTRTCSGGEGWRASSGGGAGASGRPVSASDARRSSTTRDAGHLSLESSGVVDDQSSSSCAWLQQR